MEIRKKEYAIGIDIGGTKCAVVLGRRPVLGESVETPLLDKRCFFTRLRPGRNRNQLWRTVETQGESHYESP